MIRYKLLKENGINLKKITKKNNAYIIETDSDKYVIKENETNLDSVYKYLNARGFNYFPNYRIIDNYMVYNYIEPIHEENSQKLEDLVYLISLLHLKTTRFNEVDLDDYKKIYENIDNKLTDLHDYYSNLNDQIDSEIYMSPSHYLLIRNISKIYEALIFSKNELDNWYELVKEEEKQRKVLIHNNLDIDHLLKSKNSYLISFSKSKIDFPVYDLCNLFNKYYREISFSNLFNIYKQKYPLNKSELSLLFIYISIPDKVIFKKNEYQNTIKVKDMLTKLSKSDKFIKSYYEKLEEKAN